MLALSLGRRGGEPPASLAANNCDKTSTLFICTLAIENIKNLSLHAFDLQRIPLLAIFYLT